MHTAGCEQLERALVQLRDALCLSELIQSPAVEPEEGHRATVRVTTFHPQLQWPHPLFGDTGLAHVVQSPAHYGCALDAT